MVPPTVIVFLSIIFSVVMPMIMVVGVARRTVIAATLVSSAATAFFSTRTASPLPTGAPLPSIVFTALSLSLMIGWAPAPAITRMKTMFPSPSVSAIMARRTVAMLSLFTTRTPTTNTVTSSASGTTTIMAGAQASLADAQGHTILTIVKTINFVSMITSKATLPSPDHSVIHPSSPAIRIPILSPIRSGSRFP
mmetsp:Transcript_5004/g.11038  ORF Transcript_5004/g.11038 Transcript_5004/m.11038 type:complete len:194 (+) Transcript_5004:2209-2790(+)